MLTTPLSKTSLPRTYTPPTKDPRAQKYASSGTLRAKGRDVRFVDDDNGRVHTHCLYNR